MSGFWLASGSLSFAKTLIPTGVSSFVFAEPAAASFVRWTAAADEIRATTKRLEKLAVLEQYLPTLDDESLVVACHFFSGIVFPTSPSPCLPRSVQRSGNTSGFRPRLPTPTSNR